MCKEWKRVADLVKQSHDEKIIGVYYGWNLQKNVDILIADPIQVEHGGIFWLF